MKIRFFILVLIGSFAIGSITAKIVHRLRDNIRTPEVKTIDHQRAWFEENFAKSVSDGVVSTYEFQVKFRSFCHDPRNGTPETAFILHVGDHFCRKYDEHAHSELVLAKIEKDKVMIRYRSSFDHTSFGKPMIEIDEGSFEWSPPQK